MILSLTQTEISVLLLHMSVTRKNVRNGFKRNYGRSEGKEILSSFDEIKISLETIVDALDEYDQNNINKTYELHYNVKEISMFESFLNWYISRLETVLNDAKKKTGKAILDEDKKQLTELKAIKVKVDQLKVVHNIA